MKPLWAVVEPLLAYRCEPRRANAGRYPDPADLGAERKLAKDGAKAGRGRNHMVSRARNRTAAGPAS